MLFTHACVLSSSHCILTACSSDGLENTAYRRLVDAFDSEDACLAAYTRCYDTLTFCANTEVNATLDHASEEGHYQVKDDSAIATLPTMTVIFDLQSATSEQLPGRNAWELVTPLQYDCSSSN